MSLQDLGNLGEMIAAVGVVVSLIYLAVQIRQNTSALQSNTQQSLMDSVAAVQASVSEHPDLPGLLIRANEDPDGLSVEESLRFQFFATRIFGQYENVFLCYRKQLMESELWDAWHAGFSELVQTPGFRKYWKAHKRWHHRSFRKHVDEQVFVPTD